MKEKVIEFLRGSFPMGIKIYHSPSSIEETCDIIFDENDVIIFYCKQWEYIEIYGLDSEEYDEVVFKCGSAYSSYSNSKPKLTQIQ